MNFLKKIKDIMPVSLYKNFSGLFIFTLIGIFIELLGIGLVLPIIDNYVINQVIYIVKIIRLLFQKEIW